MSNVDFITQRDSRYKLWLNAVLDNTLLSIMALNAVRDENGIIIDFEYAFINKKAEESVKRTGLTGKRFLEEFPGAKASGLFDHYVNVTETGNSWEDEFFYNKDGYKLWASVKVTRLEDGCLVMFDEITKRKKAHQELLNLKEIQTRKAADKYLSLFNSIDEAFCIIEVIFNEKEVAVDYRFLEVNPAFKKLTGLEDVIGKSARELVPGIEEYWFPIYGNVAKTGISVRFEDRAEQVYGGVWYDLYAFRIDSFGENHVAVLFNDVTKRKETEQQLKDFNATLESLVEERTAEYKKAEQKITEQAHLISQIMEVSPDYVIVYDLEEEKIKYLNRDFFYSLGYTIEEAMHQGFIDRIIHPDEVHNQKNRFLDLNLRQKEVREQEYRLKDSKGKWHFFNVRDAFFKAGANGKLKQVLTIIQDITEKREAEDAFHKEKSINEELRRINQVMDTFVYSVAHDLKAPVSNLKLLTEVIESIDDKDEKLKLQSQYPSNIQALDQVISGLISVLAIEKDPGSMKELSFQEVFTNISNELRVNITEANPEFTIDFSGCPSIRYIESYLASIFRNMLTNAMKYRSDERRLHIGIRSGHERKYIVLSFEDNGTGIDLSVYGKDLFKPFKRFNTQTEGSGIGLHLIKSIVTKNGGKIEVKSKPEKGTIFTIYLVSYN